MKPTPRALALVAVLALPVAAVVVTLLLRGSDAPVNESPVVRIGGADGSRSELPSLPSGDSASPPSTTTDGNGTGPDGPERPPSHPRPEPTRDVVPPPPPVDDDDDDDAGGDDDGGGGDDDGEED